LRSTAPAERYAIANFVRMPVGRLNANAAAHPKGTAALLRRIFNQGNRGFQRRLERFPGCAIANDQAARRTARRLVRYDAPNFAVFGLLDERPNRAGVIAKPRVRAQRAIVVERHRWTVGHLGFAREVVARSRSVPSKSAIACVPSQNGLMDEWPHRHN